LGPNGRWKCFATQELNETNDRHLWRNATEGRPLWKGESFYQYDPHGAEARLCPTSKTVWDRVRKARPGSGSLLAGDVPLAKRRAAMDSELERARIAFRDVSRGADPRTVIACLIPPEVFLTNKAPYLTFVDGDELAQAACLGFMNSLIFDWQVRRFVEINLNFFLLEGMIVPDLEDEDYADIARAAARLSAVDDRFADFARAAGVDVGPLIPHQHERLRIEIDSRVARAWDLDADDLVVMFSDFTNDAVSSDYRTAVIERLNELR
jgi:hypothetical protein